MDQTNYTNKINVTQVTDCVECTRCRKFVKFFTVISIVLLIEFAALFYLISINENVENKLTAICILAAMFGSAFILAISQIIWNVNRMRAIERGVGTLPIYKVVFEREHVVKSEWNGTRFVFELPDGSGTTVKTRPMFASTKPANLIRPPRTFIPTLYADDYIGKEVFVMYNPDKNKLYVLDFAENVTVLIDSF